MAMLPKERMIAALEHREADRVPIGEILADWDITERAIGRETYAYTKWREWTALWDGHRDEVVESYKRDLVDLTRALEWDFVVVPMMPARKENGRKPERVGEYTWRDGSGKVWQFSPESGGAAMLISAPEMSLDDIVVPDRVEVDESCLEAVAHVVKELGGTHFVTFRPPDGSFPWRETVGMEEFLIRMLTQPEFVAKATTAYMKVAQAYIEAACDLGVDGIVAGTDFCDNRGLFMGQRLFRQHVLPGLKGMVDAAKGKGKYFIKHTDGNTWEILDDFVTLGIDAWHGIQPPIGMDFGRLKEKYAGRLALFGGVNCDTLVRGTPQDVVAEVKETFAVAAPGGGYVATSGNSLLVGTKWENYAAMREAVREYGTYPIRI
jgi:uroporphyrinogen decarboxylase